MQASTRVASGAAAALLALGTTTAVWLSTPPQHDKKLALYQAKCHTLHAAVMTELAKQGHYFKALEAYRTPQQAAWNAAKGIGVRNSAHSQSLAWDMARVMPDGTVSFKPSDYALYGQIWVEAGRLAKVKTRWGGNFIRTPDYVHTSCETPDGVQ